MGHTETTLDGEPIPSVTQVLSVIARPYLMFWYGKHGTAKCEQIKKESADFGTDFHDKVEARLLGKKDALARTSAVQKAVDVFWRWSRDSDFKPLALEQKVISRKHRYAGTFDAVGTLGQEGPYVFDWKTSNQIDETYPLQLAAYAEALSETSGTSVKGGFIVRVSKDPDAAKRIEVKEYSADELKKGFKVFLAALDVWNYVNKKGIWKKAA